MARLHRPDADAELPAGKAGERKLRLFACACCRRLSDWTDGNLELATAERFADGLATRSELKAARRAAALGASAIFRTAGCSLDTEMRGCEHLERAIAAAASVAWPRWVPLIMHYANAAAMWAGLAAQDLGGARDCDREAQAGLLRDIIGNPFRPLGIDPAWLTPAVVALARGIDAERAFDRMPILADALQDAGCEIADILGHCRGEVRGHARGVLGRGSVHAEAVGESRRPASVAVCNRVGHRPDHAGHPLSRPVRLWAVAHHLCSESCSHRHVAYLCEPPSRRRG